MDNVFEDKALQIYLGDIARYSVLSREEEKEVIIKAKAGDIFAKEKLIKSNLKFVVKIASKYQNRGLTLAELISDGNIGLITAIDKFVPEKGIKLISYAVWWIPQKILYAISKKMETTCCKQKAEEYMHCSPEQSEGNRVFISENYIEESCDDPNTLFYKEKLYDSIKQSIQNLDARESFVIKSYYGLYGYEEQTFTQIAEKLGVSKEYVRKIKLKSMKKISQCVYKEKEDYISYLLSNI